MRLLAWAAAAHARALMDAAVSSAEQFHVQVTGTGQMTVSWAAPAAGSLQQRPGLLAADAGGLRLQVSHGGAVTEVAPEAQRYVFRCGALQEELVHGVRCSGADYESPLLLHANVPLEQGSARARDLPYQYRVLNASGHPLSEYRQFYAPPPAGAPRVRVAVVGDLGQTPDSAKTCRALRRLHGQQRIHAAVLVGDLAYADGNASRWDSFQRMFEETGCADVPWLVLPGNHDMEPDQLSREPFLPLRARWRTPEVRAATVDPHFAVLDGAKYSFASQYDYGGSFYSAEIGPVHFIVLDPYTDGSPGSAQIAWLKEDLQAVDRKRTPYLLCFTHAPWHHTVKVHDPETEQATLRLREAAEPLLSAARVEGVFSGHVHSYQRTRPVDGITYFVVGHGGNREGLVSSFLADPALVAAEDGGHFGFGVLDVREGEDAVWTAYDQDLKAQDSARLPSQAKRKLRHGLSGLLRTAVRQGTLLKERDRRRQRQHEQRARQRREARESRLRSLLERSGAARAQLRAELAGARRFLRSG